MIPFLFFLSDLLFVVSSLPTQYGGETPNWPAWHVWTVVAVLIVVLIFGRISTTVEAMSDIAMAGWWDARLVGTGQDPGTEGRGGRNHGRCSFFFMGWWIDFRG